MECVNRQDINSYNAFVVTLQFKAKLIASRAQTTSALSQCRAVSAQVAAAA